MDTLDIAEILNRFHALSEMVSLGRICTPTEYDNAVVALNQLLDAGGAVEISPLADLVNIVGNLIFDYEVAHFSRARCLNPQPAS